MIRILIADDHSMVRRGLKETLQEEFHDVCFHEAGNWTELFREVKANNYNIIVSDLSMPGGNGLEMLKQLKQNFPKLPVLILSMLPEDQYALRVLKAGGSGYLTKESAPEELINAVRKILNGRRYVSAAVTDMLVESLEENSSKKLHETLSDREFDVLKLIASGKTVSEIADMLSLSITTISTFRARILSKMNLKNNAGIALYAIENKLV